MLAWSKCGSGYTPKDGLISLEALWQESNVLQYETSRGPAVWTWQPRLPLGKQMMKEATKPAGT